jgi:Holliday junction resolvase
MTYARRVDANHSEIVKTLRELGCSVFDSSRMAGGFPDLVIGVNKITCLVEIKSDEKAKFTPAQEAFMLNWHGSTVARIDSVDAAIRLVNMLKKS